MFFLYLLKKAQNVPSQISYVNNKIEKRYHKSSTIVDKMLCILGFTIVTCYLMRLVFQILGFLYREFGIFSNLEILMPNMRLFSDLEIFVPEIGIFQILGFFQPGEFRPEIFWGFLFPGFCIRGFLSWDFGICWTKEFLSKPTRASPSPKFFTSCIPNIGTSFSYRANLSFSPKFVFR